MGGITLEMNYDPSMQVSKIRSGAEELEMLERRILGRADGMNEDFDSAAKEFTEVIKWDITTVSAQDLATWREVAAGIHFCAAITEEWADHVSDYKQERRRIINRWNEEAASYEQDLEKTVVLKFVWQQTPAEKAREALRELKSELVIEEAEAYGKLLSHSTDLMDDLKNGPTPEAIERLTTKGQMTWSYFNISGDVESLPLEADPEKLANNAAEYVRDPEGYEGDISEDLAIINNIIFVGADRQLNGGTMTREELEFLTKFYDALEEAGGEGSPNPGILGIANRINESQNIDEETKEKLLGTFGGGILVLSDESILGSYERIPESVRNVVEGPNEENGYDTRDWFPDVNPFSSMMEFSDPSLRGGEQFSVNLTQTVANALDVRNIDPDDEDDYRALPLIFYNEEQVLIDISTRNEDANHAILTGEGSYEHPVHGLDAEMTLRGLYAHPWDDGGSAAAGMTSWIWEQADGEEHERERAGEAMAAFIDLFSDPAFNNALSSTGLSVEGEITDENGRTVDMVWEDVSAGHYNTDLAWEWSELFSAYIDEFGSSYSNPIGGQGSHENGTYWDSEHGLMMNMDSRKNFIQQIMGDGNAASRVYAETLKYGHEELENFANGPIENGASSAGGAERSGVLRGLVDVALSEEAERRGSDTEEYQAYDKKVIDYGIDMFSAALSEIPIPGSSVVAEGIKIYAKEEFNFDSYEAEEQIDNYTGDWEIRDDAKISLIRAAADGDPQIMQEIMNTSPEMVQKDRDGNYYIPESTRNWDAPPGGTRNALDNAWEKIEDHRTSPDGITLKDARERYVEKYIEEREKVNE